MPGTFNTSKGKKKDCCLTAYVISIGPEILLDGWFPLVVDFDRSLLERVLAP